ncbi:MAG TPA: hypothetical protein VJN94_07495, partial [Candidatus Binataceae bacterium]|nr:hypothetical protein [Candidatus Binataceae bacterium]
MMVLAGCSYSLIQNGTIDRQQAEKIEAGVASMRELAFEHQVPVVIKTPDEAEQLMLAEIARDHSDEELRIGGESGAMTGLYPPKIDLKQQTVKLLRSEVIGFYNPDTKQMVIVEKPTTHNF